jgi:mono/diheme cytochrome c family protein
MRARATVLLGAVALLAGCGGGGSGPEGQFASLGCASCHTLKAAGSHGTTGPNLDELRPTAADAERQIANGGGGMPSYQDRLTAPEIRALAQYVATSAGG